MVQLESLPVEVMGVVLKNLASPEDLASLIHASPRALAALQSDRRRVLSTVIHNNLPEEVLREAYSVLRCPVLENGDGFFQSRTTNPVSPERQTKWEQKVSKFKHWYFSSATVDLGFPRETAQIVAVCRMRAVINALVSDLVYYTKTLSLSNEEQPELQDLRKAQSFPVTSRELSRIQISFFRYELICRLYGLPYLQQFSIQKVPFFDNHEAHLKHFLGYFPALYVEQLGHIHDYVCSKYTLAFKEINEDATGVFQRIQIQRDRHQIADAAVLLQKDGPSFFTHGNDPVFEIPGRPKKNTRINTYVADLAKLGLGSLQAFAKNGRLSRRRFIVETFEIMLPRAGVSHHKLCALQSFPDSEAIFMSRRLQRYIRYLEPPDEEWAKGRSVIWDACRRLENGKPCHPFLIEYRTPKIDDLRKLSWTFWDLNRLKGLGIVESFSTETHVVFNEDLKVRENYEEKISRDSGYGILKGKVSQDMWENDVVPQFCTGFSDEPNNIDEYCRLLQLILKQAEDSQIGRIPLTGG